MERISNIRINNNYDGANPKISAAKEDKQNSIFDSSKDTADKLNVSHDEISIILDETANNNAVKNANVNNVSNASSINTISNVNKTSNIDDSKEKSKAPSAQELALSQIEKELAKQKNEIQAKSSSKIGLGALWNGALGIFNKGTKGELSKVNKLEQRYNDLTNNLNQEELDKLYCELFKTQADFNKIKEGAEVASVLEDNSFVLDDGQKVSKEDVANLLTIQGEQLQENFNQTVKSQGFISKGLGFLNNTILGLGATKKAGDSQIENYQNLIQELNNTQTPEEFSSLYKSITGEELTKESLNSLFQGESKVENSAAAEAIMDYESTQETVLTTTSSLASGTICAIAVAAAPVTGGASLALGAGLGAASNVTIKGFDSASKTNGDSVIDNVIDYAKKDLFKDTALGTINGLSFGIGNAAGAVVKTKAASLAGNWLGSRMSPIAINATARVAGEFVDGAADGAISNAGEYLIDCFADKDKKFKLSEFKDKTLLGGAFGGVLSVGMQEGVGLIKNIGNVKDYIDVDIKDAQSNLAKADNSVSEKAILANSRNNKNGIIDKYNTLNNSKTKGYGENADLLFNKNKGLFGLQTKNIKAPASTDDTIIAINKLVDIGKLPSDVNYSQILNNPTKISREIYNDLTKLYDAYSKGIDIEDAFITKFPTEKAAKANLDVGDVCQIAGSEKIAIKLSNGKIKELGLTPQKYLELFPPVKRYATMQGGLGDCYLISSLDMMFKTPQTKAKLLECFTQQADGSVKVKIGDVSVKFEDGIDNLFRKDLDLLGYKTNIDGCDGFKMLEETFGFAYTDKRALEATRDLAYFKPGTKEYQEASQLLSKLQDTNKYIGDIGVESRGHGGYSADVFRMFGFKEARRISGESFIDNFLKNSKNWDKYIITAGTSGESDSLFINEGLKIAQSHAYGVQPYISDAGQTMFKVINPWDCGSNLDLTFEEFKKYFTSIDVARKK